jgi:hypothetical protein
MTQQTRSRILAGLLSVAVLLPAAAFNSACRGKRATTVQNDEGTPQPVNLPPASSLKMSDAGAPGQIVRGVYPLEANAWRWTAGNFSILLKTPPGAAQKGATVSLTLVVSDAVLKQVKSQTLTASVGDKSVGSEKYTTAGDFAFAADIPATALTGDTVTVDFSLDNSLPPGPADRRELGIIVSAISIDSK